MSDLFVQVAAGVQDREAREMLQEHYFFHECAREGLRLLVKSPRTRSEKPRTINENSLRRQDAAFEQGVRSSRLSSSFGHFPYAAKTAAENLARLSMSGLLLMKSLWGQLAN